MRNGLRDGGGAWDLVDSSEVLTGKASGRVERSRPWRLRAPTRSWSADSRESIPNDGAWLRRGVHESLSGGRLDRCSRKGRGISVRSNKKAVRTSAASDQML